MIFTRQLAYDIKGILTDWVLYFALVLSVLPAYGILYSIVNFQGPFNVTQVTYFYAFFGSVLSIIVAIRPFVKDLQNNTIVLFMNKRSNRYKYYVSKLTAGAVTGLIFGVFCTFVLMFASGYADLEIQTALYFEVIVHYILFTLFYTSVFLAMSTFIKGPIALIVSAILSIMLLPTLLQVPVYIEQTPEAVITFINDYLPFSFAPDVIGLQDFTSGQYVSTIGFIVLFILLGVFKAGRTDY